MGGIGLALANQVSVMNPDLGAPGNGLVKVRFDLSWENSWRDADNYDACWVFMKYSTNAGVTWGHATLAGSGTNPVNYSAGTGTGLDVVVPSDQKGAFIQRSSAGTGTVSNKNVNLVWNFKADGVAAGQLARIKVFALEMVHVPQGSFYAGDGTTNSLQGEFENGANTNALLITSEGQLTLGGGTPGSLGNNNTSGMSIPDDFNDVTNQILPAAFPKGYGAFYLMKTEISQKQYCDFLNTLTAAQQVGRYDKDLHFDYYRNFIKKTGETPAIFGCDAGKNAGNATSATSSLLNEANDGQWVACSFLSWADGVAYADWAALRPMTELEFEKACRGPLAPVADEYAWGNTTLETATSALTGGGTSAEVPNQGNCNTKYPAVKGTFRVGCFADATSSRQNAGAGYYGALDLSGSLSERPVSVGNATGRLFTGTPGDGNLNAYGDANVPNWPGTNAVGSAIRGGGWNNGEAALRVSCRYSGAQTYNTRTSSLVYYGWRGARTAP